VAGVFDAPSGLVRIYVDGVVDGEIVAPFHSLYEANEPLLIGAGDEDLEPRRFLEGALDDVRLYGRALSDAEVLQLFQLRGNACL
jgi:alpha-N-arabinofuranosidase